MTGSVPREWEIRDIVRISSTHSNEVHSRSAAIADVMGPHLLFQAKERRFQTLAAEYHVSFGVFYCPLQRTYSPSRLSFRNPDVDNTTLD